MDLHIKKVWLPGAASCLVFFGFYWVLIWLPFDKNRFQFMAIPYLVLPFAGALAAYWSRRMKGSVLERILSALFPVFAFVALFAVRIVYGLFFEGKPYTLPHFLAGFSVTLVFIVVGGLLLVLGAWPFCRPHLQRTVALTTGLHQRETSVRSPSYSTAWTSPTSNGPCSNRPSARAVAWMGAAGRGPIRGPS